MKNKLFFFLFFLFSTLLSGNVMAQEVIERSTDKTKIGGKEYYLHRVRQGQTLYSLSKAYNVSVEEIELLNPEVKDGLKVGHVLGIPVRPVQEPKVEEPLPVTVKPDPEPVSEQKPVTVKPVKPEPKEEPVVVKPEPEPEPEPVKVKPVKPEPKEEPVVEKPEPEPEPEPVKVKPVKPEPKEEPVVVQPEPEPEPVVVEPVNPEPEPVVEQEPALEPELEPKTVVVKPVKPEPEPVVEQPKEQETPVVIEPQPNHKPFFDGKARIVQHGEDLYDIAKEYGIDVADLKQANPRMTFEDPKEGTRIVIPQVANENDYIVHSCEYNERVSSLLKRWKVDENAFRNINVSVGSHVFENQVVLIPIQPITDFYWIPQEKEKDEVVEVVEVEEPEESQDIQEHQPLEFDFETGDIPDCVAAPENASKRYHVALMVPLYLNNIGSVDVSKDNASKTKKSRPMSFLQFYEGFMIAAEAMEKQGMKLDLTIIDVTDNTATAENAVAKIQNKDLDLIVGPFFGNSFDIVEEYAKANDIAVVNPMTTRKSVIEDNPNVIKAKSGDVGMILSISNLVKNRYPNANVFIVSREKDTDTAFLDQLEHHLNMAINEEVTVSGDEFLQYARNESERLEMGSRMVPTIDVEGQVYSTGDFQTGMTNEVVLSNKVNRYPYSKMGEVRSRLSGVRDNVIIAYGDDNVFATQMLNSLTRTAERYPVTLICAPDWQKHEKLLVDNLLKMNAIYVSDYFVDYNSEEAKNFVIHFRQKYVVDPQRYAFEGYDVGKYFLNALMQYGSDDLINCLHCYQASMLHTNYRFYYKNYLNAGGNEGKENLYWSIYQYDKDNIELVPVDPFKKPAEDD